MKLTPQQFDQLQRALLNGFNRDELTRMVRVGLGETLTQIASGDTDSALVQSLVEWSERTENVAALIAAAVQANPRNKQLHEFERDAEGWFGSVAKAESAASEVVPESRTASTRRTILPAVWNVPLRRNPNFTGRSEQLSSLHDAFNSGEPGSSVHAVSGLGGVGKTQVATEYAYRYSADYDVIWWVHSEEPVSLTSDYAGLATALKLPEAEAVDQCEAVQAVKRWLSENRRWLLVLDNATDFVAVRDYLPAGDSGHVLITSRNPIWGRLGVSENLPVLSPEEAVEFLLHRTSQQDKAAATSLAEELGYLPLALEQAGAYMEQSSRSLSDYLVLYASRRRDLLKRGKPEGDYPDTVFTTWQISFDEASKVAGATELLSLCAYLAPNAIPLELIREFSATLPDILAKVAADELCLDDAVVALRSYSIVQVEDGELDVHRLVQEVVRNQLDTADQKIWAAAAVRLVDSAFPEGSDDVRTWPFCERLLAHALIATRHSSFICTEPSATGRLLSNVGDHLWGQARYLDAKTVLEQAVVIDEAAYGPDHSNVARDVNNLGVVLQDLGDLEGAKQAIERALKIDEAALGPDHPTVAIRLSNLGTLLRRLGDLEGGRQAIERALKIDEAALGFDHLSVATDLSKLGSSLLGLGDLEGAKQAFERALKIDEAALGPNHPNVARDISGLGWVLEAHKKLDGAKLNFERALKIDEAALGPDHPDVAKDVSDLGWVLYNLGDMEGAKKALERALKIYEAALGPDHPTVATRVNDLGRFLYDLGDMEGAKQAFERALKIDEATLGPDHPTVATRVNNLGWVLYNLGDMEGAKQAFERALKIDEAALGPDHPTVAIRLSNLSTLLRKLGDMEEARQAIERALKIDEAAFGPDHPIVATRVNNLGRFLYDLGDMEGAKKAFERALKIDEAAFGPDHPEVATCVYNLGWVLYNLGDLEGAKQAFERALKIDEAALGPDHPTVAIRLSNLSTLLRKLGDMEEARQAIERALKIDEAAFGPDHPIVATRVNNLGWVLYDLGDMEGAKKAFERALKIDEAAFGPDHPEVATCVYNLGWVLYNLGDLEGAKQAFERALTIFRKSLGDDHRNTQIVRVNLESLEF